MDKKEFVSLVIESLEAIGEEYRKPYGRPYERIICYEFYHQLRKRLDKKRSKLVLHGELGKGYRGIRKVPDFVFHLPRTDVKNFAVMEFKSVRSGMRWIRHDLRKLEECRKAPLNYQLGILVIFGEKNKLVHIEERLLKLSDRIDRDLEILLYDSDDGKVISSVVIGKSSIR